MPDVRGITRTNFTPMKLMIKRFKAFVKGLYISSFYLLRNSIKWKKINSVYLKINDQLISRPLFGNIVFGDYEIDENRILKETLHKEDVVLELGTGLGYNSIFAARIINNRVTSFEANPNLIPLIRQNMEKNKVRFDVKNQVVVPKDLNNRAFEFNVVENFWSSSLKNNVDGKIVEKVMVPSCKLTEILSTIRPTYLIVDIEGGEEDFFEDCTLLADSSIKKILLELHANIIGEEKCSMVIRNIIKSGFNLRLDSSPKNVMFFSR